MALGYPEAIAISVGIVSLIGGIIKFIPKSNKNGNNHYNGIDRRVCSEHSGIKVAVERLESDVGEMKGDIKEIQKDVKELLQR